MNLRSIILLLLLPLTACQGDPSKRLSDSFDVQGHRGCRGLLPENSIPGFLEAVRLGVTTLEMDVVITADRRVVLSHEPFISHTICLDSTGREIDRAAEKDFNIFQMTYEEVLLFDCGSKLHSEFPDQQKMDVRKPLLEDAIREVEQFVERSGLPPVRYNIETKSSDLGDNIFHPEPEEFATLLLDVIKDGGIRNRTIIQSFDPRTLNAVNDLDTKVRTALLVSNQLGYRHNLSRLDFTPDIFSPNKIFITHGMIEFMHGEGIEVIPWTVNKANRMRELIDMGVDGIITDYPDILVKVVEEMEAR